MEIRLHGRGGQGGVTCAKILAALYARLGKSVQAFGDYAGERSGAPVRAYVRVADGPITDRNKVYQPDHLVVLDPSLLGDATVAGLRPGGVLLVNSTDAPEVLAARFPGFRVATVDATGIARANGIGSRSLVIVNTTIAGAFARLLELPLDEVEAAYRQLGVGHDVLAARAAHDAVRWTSGAASGASAESGAAAASPWGQTALGPVQDLVDHVEGPAPLLHTGAWRTQVPRFTIRLAPCSAVCPAGNDVVGFVQALARQDDGAAADVLGQTSPLAGVCGRVCPAFCMLGCNRRDLDGAVDVRGVERWISDHATVARARPSSAKPARRRRVAIVGGGPAGLSAAYTLAQLGHEAIVYEGERKLGGVLHTGIPTYRLPRDVLEREVAGVVGLGVTVRTGERLGPERLAQLPAEYDAVILALGLQKLTRLDLPGRQLVGVEQGVRFLHRVNVAGDAHVTGHVVVLGGGNTAMDCARSALRLGADRVTVAYRRTEAEMPAIPDEVEEAREEGVIFEFQCAPVGFEGDGQRVRGIVLAEVEMGAPDESGRRRPVVTGRTTSVACDHVLLALGQSQDLTILPAGWTLERGRLSDADRPMHVYAAGDLATGDGTVTHAIGDGRRAALLALAALGETVPRFERPDAALAVKTSDIRFSHFDQSAPASQKKEPPRARAHHFDEVSHGLGDPGEAHRCLSCGHCTHCDTCLVYCPDGIIHRRDGAYEVDRDYCKGCGICVVECPRGAMEMVQG